jgi:glucokinase
VSIDMNYVIGLEFGGQSVKAARVDQSGDLAGPYRFELEERSPPHFNEYVKGVTSIIQKAKENCDISAVGVACPNPYCSKGIILNLNHKPAYEHVNGKPMENYILGAAGCDSLFDIYDAGAAVRGELWKGDLPKKGRHMFLTLGTGLGSAFVFNGEIIKGRLGAPESGEIWDLQYKGKNLEEWAGTMKVMVRMYERKGGTNNEVRNGNIKYLAGIAEDTHHPEYYLARDTFKEFGTSLGAALAFACSDFESESFILSGNISKSFGLFEEGLKSYMENVPLNNDTGPVFKQSRLIDRNGLLGAAYVALAGKGIPTSNLTE